MKCKESVGAARDNSKVSCDLMASVRISEVLGGKNRRPDPKVESYKLRLQLCRRVALLYSSTLEYLVGSFESSAPS